MRLRIFIRNVKRALRKILQGKESGRYKRGEYRQMRLGVLLMCLVLSCCLAGCSGYADSGGDSEQTDGESAVVEYTCISKPESKKKIYVILKNYHGDYWKKVIEGISKAARKIDAAVYLGGIDNETDISGQIDLVNEAVKKGADGIMLAPASSMELIDSCEKIRESNIPLVLIDSSINSTEFDACYMTDNMEAGKMAAKEMLDMLKEQGNSSLEPLEVGIMLSSDTSQAMVNRISGFLEYWTNYAPSQWGIAKEIYLNGGDVRKAQSDASKLLKKNENIKGIFGCNNTSTIGITNTLLKEKRTDIAMVGFDMAEETKQIIQNTDYHAVSLLQKQDQMGYLGMQLLDSLIKGENSEQKYFDTGVIMIDSDYLMEKGVS